MATESPGIIDPAAIDRWPKPPDLSKRRLTPEWMDDPRLDPAEHHRALRGLARLNLVSRASHHLWRPIQRELDRVGGRRLHLLDVACGDGKVLCDLVRRGRSRLVATGIDVSPKAIADASAQRMKGMRFVRMDALDPSTDLPRADIVLCSLFLHHLRDEEVIVLLTRMGRAARRRVIISDLERSRASWLAIWLASRLLTRSSVVHHDSARSVEGAWRPDELTSLARLANLNHVQMVRTPPCRLVMIADPIGKTRPD